MEQEKPVQVLACVGPAAAVTVRPPPFLPSSRHSLYIVPKLPSSYHKLSYEVGVDIVLNKICQEKVCLNI